MCTLVLHFYKLSMDLVTLTGRCVRVRVCGPLAHATGSVGHICSVVNQLQACWTKKRPDQWLKLFCVSFPLGTQVRF